MTATAWNSNWHATLACSYAMIVTDRGAARSVLVFKHDEDKVCAVLPLRCRSCCCVRAAGSRRAAVVCACAVAHRRRRPLRWQITTLDSTKILGASGENSDRVALTEYIKANLSLEKYRSQLDMSTAATASWIRDIVSVPTHSYSPYSAFLCCVAVVVGGGVLAVRRCPRFAVTLAPSCSTCNVSTPRTLPLNLRFSCTYIVYPSGAADAADAGRASPIHALQSTGRCVVRHPLSRACGAVHTLTRCSRAPCATFRQCRRRAAVLGRRAVHTQVQHGGLCRVSSVTVSVSLCVA
jgi:hypothetical protein